MKNWVQKNFRQILVMVLSLACGMLIIYRPEYRDAIVSFGGLLAIVGIHLNPVAYGAPNNSEDPK